MAEVDLKKGRRIIGEERATLASLIKTKYEKGVSIRELADSLGRSYGWVNEMLREAGVTLRKPGGHHRTKAEMGNNGVHSA